MGYSIDPISANCYPGTTVLINKFDIHDEEKLNEIESVTSSARCAEWLNAPQAAAFDFDHYKAIHRFLFSDLYEWAGEVRGVNISKKGTQFTPAENIESQAGLIFERLRTCNYFKGLPQDEFVAEIVDFYCVTNALHPFRDGNGRIGRLWHTLLLTQWKPMFAWLLVESMIHDRQDEYYQAINRSNNEAESTAFIEFMLSAIKEALLETVQVGNTENMSTEEQRRYQIERFLRKNETITNADVRELLGISAATANRILARMTEDGKIRKIRIGKSWGYIFVK